MCPSEPYRDDVKWRILADISSLEGGMLWPEPQSSAICGGVEEILPCGHIVCISCGEEDEVSHRTVSI